MTEQYPDWVYDEMAKRVSDAGSHGYTAGECRDLVSDKYQAPCALAKLIHETQEAPEDPYLPIARKVAAGTYRKSGNSRVVSAIEAGEQDNHSYVQFALTAIHALLEHQEQQP